MKRHSALLPLPPPLPPIMVPETNHQRVSSLQVFFVHLGGFRGDSVVKNLPVNVGDTRVVWEEMATRSSILAWKIQWTEDPGGLQYLGLQ